jgi:HEPN domain-containing protein
LKTDENNPADWLRSAHVRLRSLDILHAAEGATESVVELLQEAAERSLKAYLLSQGWRLRKIHDLGALVADAVEINPRFIEFEDFADSLTDQFWAQHYPGGDIEDVGRDYPKLRQSLAAMISIIEAAIHKAPDHLSADESET